MSQTSDQALSGNRLTVDLEALVGNYRQLGTKSGAAQCAAVVKADAYGLGAAQIVPALGEAGCRRFFVATAAEGLQALGLLRASDDPACEVFVLNGCDEATMPAFATSALVPVLNSPEQIRLWLDFQEQRKAERPACLHVDTGMNRLGLSREEADALAGEGDKVSRLHCILLMSHLACADEPQHPKNREQLAAFLQFRKLFPGIAASLANSAGIDLGPDYHFDWTRPGIALYGGKAVNDAPPLSAVATVEARIIRVRRVPAGQSVGYGATFVAPRDMVVAIAAAGYADGYHRASSHGNAGKTSRPVAHGRFRETKVPVIGRVSMDMTAFDITEVPGADVGPDEMIELIGPNIAVDDVARAAGTIGYEILTSLGHRYQRRYLPWQSAS